MQRQSVNIDRWRKRVHLLHGFKAFHNFDQLNADIRTDDWNVVCSEEISSTFRVKVIHQHWNSLCRLFVYENCLAVFASCHREYPRHHWEFRLASADRRNPAPSRRRTPASFPAQLLRTPSAENRATFSSRRSEERRVGKECRCRWLPPH